MLFHTFQAPVGLLEEIFVDDHPLGIHGIIMDDLLESAPFSLAKNHCKLGFETDHPASIASFVETTRQRRSRLKTGLSNGLP